MAKESKPIGLAEFIHQVKKDLLDQQFAKDDPVPLFAIQEVEVEVAVTATREVEGGLKAGINLAVIGLGGLEASTGGKLNRENAHTVRIKLAPLRTREELLAVMSPEELEQVKKLAEKALTRGAGTSGRDAA